LDLEIRGSELLTKHNKVTKIALKSIYYSASYCKCYYNM